MYTEENEFEIDKEKLSYDTKQTLVLSYVKIQNQKF